MHLLTKDYDILLYNYNEAYKFIIAAELRYECFSLIQKFKNLNNWEKKRLKELLTIPACIELSKDFNKEI